MRETHREFRLDRCVRISRVRVSTRPHTYHLTLNLVVSWKKERKQGRCFDLILLGSGICVCVRVYIYSYLDIGIFFLFFLSSCTNRIGRNV